MKALFVDIMNVMKIQLSANIVQMMARELNSTPNSWSCRV